MEIELLWFEDCPNHRAAEQMLIDVLEELHVKAPVRRVEVPDVETGRRVRFPGSPTIRINGKDVEPGWADCEDCTPRCRLYATSEGLKGLPERAWVRDAVVAAIGQR